jgi:hypothetical protein
MHHQPDRLVVNFTQRGMASSARHMAFRTALLRGRPSSPIETGTAFRKPCVRRAPLVLAAALTLLLLALVFTIEADSLVTSTSEDASCAAPEAGPAASVTLQPSRDLPRRLPGASTRTYGSFSPLPKQTSPTASVTVTLPSTPAAAPLSESLGAAALQSHPTLNFRAPSAEPSWASSSRASRCDLPTSRSAVRAPAPAAEAPPWYGSAEGGEGAEVTRLLCPPSADPGILAGGLHNQLQDLAAYAAVACPAAAGVEAGAAAAPGPSTRGAVRLPPLKDDAGRHHAKQTIPFWSVFDEEAFARAAVVTNGTTASCAVLPSHVMSHTPCTPIRHKGSAVKGAKDRLDYPPAYRSLVYRSIELTAPLRAVLDGCIAERDAAFGCRGAPFIAVHMRVENDWRKYCVTRERYEGQREKVCFTPRDIAGLVQRRFGGYAASRRIVVIGALDRTAPEFVEGPESVFDVWGPNTTVFSASRAACLKRLQLEQPGNGGAESMPLNLTYTQRAAIETFFAADADVFVGTTPSSFSVGVATMRAHRPQWRARDAASASASLDAGPLKPLEHAQDRGDRSNLEPRPLLRNESFAYNCPAGKAWSLMEDQRLKRKLVRFECIGEKVVSGTRAPSSKPPASHHSTQGKGK